MQTNIYGEVVQQSSGSLRTMSPAWAETHPASDNSSVCVGTSRPLGRSTLLPGGSSSPTFASLTYAPPRGAVFIPCPECLLPRHCNAPETRCQASGFQPHFSLRAPPEGVMERPVRDAYFRRAPCC